MQPNYKALAAVQGAVAKQLETRAVQQLMGIVQGVIADGHLHDSEIHLLRTWTVANQAACQAWPGQAVAAMVAQVLEDGVIDEDERTLLLENLAKLCGNDFAATGSASAEPTNLPVDDSVQVSFDGATVVHTGSFLYGTRARCERATSSLGGLPAGTVTRRTKILVIGGMVSPHWITESFGRKIMQAVALRDEGLPIAIISEARWLQHIGGVA